MSNLVILKWRPFEYKENLKKVPLSFRFEIGIFDIFLKRLSKKVLKIYKSISIENFKLVPLCPFKIFAKLNKSPPLIPNIVKGAVSGLRQFLATESP